MVMGCSGIEIERLAAVYSPVWLAAMLTGSGEAFWGAEAEMEKSTWVSSLILSNLNSQTLNLCVSSYDLSPFAPSPSSCAAAVVVTPGRQEEGSRVCTDPTEPDRETGWCGNVGNAAAHGSGSPRGRGSWLPKKKAAINTVNVQFAEIKYL